MATKSEQKIYVAVGVLAVLSGGLFIQQKNNRSEAMAHSQSGTAASLPEIKVAAVVHQPLGAFPSPVQGYYRRHHDFFRHFHDESRTVEGNRAWLERWVFGVDDWKGFLDKVGAEILEPIRIRRPLPSEPLDYGA